jgi:hypothetical protein
MNVSLDQAIEIHAKALNIDSAIELCCWRRRRRIIARRRGMMEGYAVWLRVASVAEMLLEIRS